VSFIIIYGSFEGMMAPNLVFKASDFKNQGIVK
jgi:hypothetical protein